MEANPSLLPQPYLSAQKKIILFDGVCNLCNNTVQFIIKNDPKAKFLFASLQSPFGQKFLNDRNLDPQSLSSIILKEPQAYYTKSTAVLRILKELHRGWFLLYGFIIIPAFLRNIIYDIIAKNRYLWFGKKETCMLPNIELSKRFI